MPLLTWQGRGQDGRCTHSTSSLSHTDLSVYKALGEVEVWQLSSNLGPKHF